jgi:pyruvate kinase
MSGIIKSNKGLNFPDINLNLSAVTHEDIENLKLITNYADAVTISFVNSHNDISLVAKELLHLG